MFSCRKGACSILRQDEGWAHSEAGSDVGGISSCCGTDYGKLQKGCGGVGLGAVLALLPTAEGERERLAAGGAHSHTALCQHSQIRSQSAPAATSKVRGHWHCTRKGDCPDSSSCCSHPSFTAADPSLASAAGSCLSITSER